MTDNNDEAFQEIVQNLNLSENDDEVKELIDLACQRSANGGIQLTTYKAGETEVAWIDTVTHQFTKVDGRSPREALLNMLLQTRPS